ncbi:LacI family DNA-binding transcriptional regulator [Salinimonas chungwhensis]|uniref:LacI family DNA-binding transcriptional regulator n=1 Tax=Salinimonas chungwhensis TaxID=265425 RepID=UPI00036FE516|nr:LacI family DNA-binding transcriptional regulator [Salinimonas chungwhensis]
MNKNKLTLKGVADLIGVSTATISNAFNRPDQLSAKKREEILAQCKKIGYHGPNKAAQILRKGESGIVALILADSIEYMVSDPVASMFIKGVSRVLSEHNKHLLLFSGNEASIRNVSDFVDGFICYGAPHNRALADELKSLAKAVVTVDFDIDGLPSVNIDNEQAAFDIASQTIESDDNIAVLGLKLIDASQTCRIDGHALLEASTSISHRRLNGYKRAAAQHGKNIDNHLIWHIPESQGHYAKEAAVQALDSIPRPTTIMCMSDIIALELLQVALARGIRVPDELKITGFDGIEEAARTRPLLTTVCQSSINKGELAARQLLNHSMSNEVLAYEIIAGETV